MKSLKQRLTEALQINGRKFDPAQLYQLSKHLIDAKAFAINTEVSNDDAKEIETVLEDGMIQIISMDDIKSAYPKDYCDKLSEEIDKFIDNPMGYGTELGLTDAEKKQRAQAVKASGEQPKVTDDTKYVEDIISSLLTIQPKAVIEYFWKKSGDDAYLFIVTDQNEIVDKIIEKI